MIKKCTSVADYESAKEIVQTYVERLDIDLAFQNYQDEMESFTKIYAPPKGAFFIAKHEDITIGGIGLRPFKDNIGELKRLYVKEHLTGKSFGKKLVRAAIEEAKKLGYKELLLDTLPAMNTAKSIYLAEGFKAVQSYRYNPLPGAEYFKLIL